MKIDFIKNNITLVISISSFLLISFFELLDYYTFTNTFHFSNASFIEIYFYSLGLASQMLTLVTLFPFMIMFILIYPIYLNSKILSSKLSLIESNINCVIVVVLGMLMAIILLFLSVSTYFVLTKLPFNAFIFILIAMIISYSSTSLIIVNALKRLKLDIRIITKNELFLFLFIVTFILCYTYFITVIDGFEMFNYIDDTAILYLIFIMFIQFISVIILSLKEISLYNNTYSEKNYIDNIYAGFIIIFLMIAFLNHEDIDTWNDTKEKQGKFSSNLFINKFYLATNHTIFDLNTTNYENSTTKIEYCTQANNEIIDSNLTTYLPISKEMKLYFKEKQDYNITCIYAVNKIIYKNKYNYILKDIGYIDINATQKNNNENK